MKILVPECSPRFAIMKTILAYSILLAKSSLMYSSDVDCTFDHFPMQKNQEFCSWQPDLEGLSIWSTDNAILVDSANSVIKSPLGNDRFAFVRGKFGGPTSGKIKSPAINPVITQRYSLLITYWKATEASTAFGSFVITTKSAVPSLDICISDDVALDVRLRKKEPYEEQCIDTITGPGQHQWVRRTIELPQLQHPYSIVLRARDVLSGEDVICVDDLKLLNANNNQHSVPSSSTSPLPVVKYDYSFTPFPTLLAPFVPSDLQSIDSSTVNTSILLHPGIKLSENYQNAGLERISPPFTKQIPPRLGELVLSPSSNCMAVKCSFLYDACLWKLGVPWKQNEGNIAIESGKAFAESSKFKIDPLFNIPVLSLFDFELWMSNESELMISEEVEVTGEQFILLKLSNANSLNNELKRTWQRFRVPIRPSLYPLVLKIYGNAPENGFIAISNTRLVDLAGNELNCETFQYGENLYHSMEFPYQSIGNRIALPKNVLHSAMPFNPFMPMLEGLMPIVPVKDKDRPERLTAMQNSAMAKTRTSKPTEHHHYLKRIKMPSKKTSPANEHKEEQLLPISAKDDNNFDNNNVASTVDDNDNMENMTNSYKNYKLQILKVSADFL